MWCGCNSKLNHGDCDAVVADRERQLWDRGPVCIGAGLCCYSIKGSAVAFACNQCRVNCRELYGGNDFTCSAYIVTQDYGRNPCLGLPPVYGRELHDLHSRIRLSSPFYELQPHELLN
jgi:hypothetical protein